jgi:hypothetical protein
MFEMIMNYKLIKDKSIKISGNLSCFVPLRVGKMDKTSKKNFKGAFFY